MFFSQSSAYGCLCCLIALYSSLRFPLLLIHKRTETNLMLAIFVFVLSFCFCSFLYFDFHFGVFVFDLWLIVGSVLSFLLYSV